MSGQESKKRNIRSLIITAVVILGSLGAGYLTGNQQFVLDLMLGLGLIFLAITILVSIHELGHFLTARMFGMRVETFSIGFPPKIFGVKREETEYQIGATPIGGYVKISGMIDESFDTDYIEKEPQPYEFRSKPVWQRLIVMLGGVVMNVILGILIFSTFKYITGDQLLPMEAVNRNGIEVFPNTIGDSLGFQTGDKVLNCNGEELLYFSNYLDLTPVQSEGYYEVERAGKVVRLNISRTAINYFANDSLDMILFVPDAPCNIRVDTSLIDSFRSIIPQTVQIQGISVDSLFALAQLPDSVQALSPQQLALLKSLEQIPVATGAVAAGLRNDDQITKLDDTPINLFSDLRKFIRHIKRDTILVTYLRSGKQEQRFLVLKEIQGGRKIMGVANNWQTHYKDDYITLRYNFFEALGPGTKEAFKLVSSQAQGLARLPESGIKTRQLIQGPIEIAKFYVQQFKEGGWPRFLWLTGVLSMILALMNILPIPALDGGHIVFLLFEGITGREPSTQVKIIAQYIGLILVFSLMAFLLLNGILKQF